MGWTNQNSGYVSTKRLNLCRDLPIAYDYAQFDHLPAMSSQSRKASLRDRIFQQALKEFSKNGYAGARVDRIAKKARVNKQLIYYYFESKENLFRVVIESIWETAGVVEQAPGEAGDAVRYWSQFYIRYPEWARLLLWEGLEWKSRKMVGETERKSFWRTSLQQLERRCGPNGWPVFFDARQYLLSVVAMEIAPLAFPQLVRLIFDREASDPKFLQERTEFLVGFARFVAGTEPAQGRQPKRRGSRRRDRSTRNGGEPDFA
jgi:TetR/AcrR family transcriptional regulator